MIRRIFNSLFVSLLLASFCAGAEGDAQLIRSGRIDDAINQLQQRVKNNPNDADALNLLARAYYSIEQWDNAIATNQRALKLQPNSSEFHAWMGRAYGEKAENVGMIGAATLARKTKSEFEKAVQLNPAATQSRVDLAEYYTEAPGFMGGSMDRARAQAEATARLDVAASHLIRARMAQQQKDFENAELEFKAAIATAKNPSTYWINLASFYQSRERFPEMERAIASAVAVSGRASSVLYDAGRILNHSNRNLPAASQYMRQYLAEGRFDEDAPSFRAHYLLGQILEKQSRRPDAIQEYQAALSLASDFKKAQDALGRLQS